jgi:AcrR family transcriptional regulator
MTMAQTPGTDTGAQVPGEGAAAPGTPPVGKRRMRGPERKAQLLSVARKVFGRLGFHNASLDDVAKEAGVTKPIVYDHFTSKEALYLSLLDADAASLEERVRTALSARSGNRERIRQSFKAYLDFVDEHPEGFRMVMEEMVGPQDEFRSKVGGVRERIRGEVTDLIVRESRGRISRTDAETVSLGLIGMVETVAQRDPGGPADERARSVDVLVALAWRGITALGD